LLLKSVSEIDGKVVERHGSMRMTRGTMKCKYSSMEVNGLIYIRQNTSLLESVTETVGKVAESHGSVRMTRRMMECKCSLIQVNGLI